MRPDYDIAIIGSGFAGSLMSMIARRLGRSVVLIDKVKHPRVVIGESSTPLTNLFLEELADRYDLPGLRPLTKWGSWQRSYPEIACGLKRGFSFYHHELDRPVTCAPDRTRQLLVAGSPNDETADTHWYRADFDHLFVRQAGEMGVDYLDETYLDDVTRTETGINLHGRRKDDAISLSARFVIDASGPRGCLHRAFGLKSLGLPDLPQTQAIYSHFTGVGLLGRSAFGANDKEPPYPIDDAAVHHVFDGGWVWVLRFNNGITSAGVAATDKMASRLNFSRGAEAWGRLLEMIPALEYQFSNATPTRPFTYLPQLSHRSSEVSGANWVLLPSAAGFVDPLLSTGFPLTLLGIGRLGEIIESDWASDAFPRRLADYAVQTEAELLAAGRLIAALYANMHDFPVFSALSLLYFSAVSYAETARRLGKPHLAAGFLLSGDPMFGRASVALLERALRPRSGDESSQLVSEILRTIEPFDIAGLGDRSRANWFPVDANDLFRSATKVESSRGEIEAMLRRCGFGTP